jgi:hypothetical protein
VPSVSPTRIASAVLLVSVLKAQLRGEALLVEPIVYTLDEETLSRLRATRLCPVIVLRAGKTVSRAGRGSIGPRLPQTREECT